MQEEDIIYNLLCIIEDNRIFCFQADGIDTLLDVKREYLLKPIYFTLVFQFFMKEKNLKENTKQ